MFRIPSFCRHSAGRASSDGTPGRRTAVVGCCCALLLFVGCNVTQLAELRPRQPLLPSAEINPDLVRPFRPSNDRQWERDQAVLAYAQFDDDLVTVHNVRNCFYYTTDDYIVQHHDKTYDLRELDSVDFIIVPFRELPMLGHTMISFGFGGRDYLCVSVEIRKEQGERFGAVQGFFNQYELMYVVGDERDLIKLRTNYREDEVYVYPVRTSPDRIRDLFVDVMQRVNDLARQPEFYNTLTNNCTTNIRNHINRLTPDRVPYDYRVLLSGYSDRLAYDLGLLDTETSFAQTKRRAKVNYQAYLYRNSLDFSVRIRR